MDKCKCRSKIVVRWIEHGETEVKENPRSFPSVDGAELWIKANLEVDKLIWWIAEVSK